MSPQQPVVAGAVLVGGASIRMGRDKATIEVGGRALGQLAVDALIGNGLDPVLLIGATSEHRAQISGTAVADLWPGDGPVGALLTALHQGFLHGASHVAVLACDLPAIESGAVASMISELRATTAVIAEVDGAPAFPNGIWPVALLPELESRFIDGADSFRELTTDLEVATFPGGAAFADADQPEDLTPFL